jgi:outer membrane immunogenic protein
MGSGHLFFQEQAAGNMRRFATALIAAGAMAFVTSSADAQSRQPMWQGFYAGVNAGAVLGSLKVSEPPTPTTYRWDHDGMALGGHAGYNMVFSNIFAGIEGDLSWTNADGKLTITPGNTVTTESRYMGSIRARLGLNHANTLWYGTLGWGMASVKASMPGSSDTDRLNGLVYGLGMETRLFNNISGRVEAIHYALRKSENDTGLEIKTEMPQTVIRAGITFHLN